MRATFRPLPTWPYPPRPKATVPFRSGWEDTLDKLEEADFFRELGQPWIDPWERSVERVAIGWPVPA